MKRVTLRHIIIKLSKDKDRILKTASKKPLVMYKRASPFSAPVVLSADFFAARRKRYDLLKILKKEYCQPRVLCLAKLSLRDKDFLRQIKAGGVNHHLDLPCKKC